MNCEEIFNELWPGFFQQESIRCLPDNRTFCEMVMDLSEAEMPALPCSPDIIFGEYRGDIDLLRQSVTLVDRDWVRYFNQGERFFCAMDGDKIASFCILDQMGDRIAGPGCVGTVPQYRRKGIGLEMVRRATLLLKDGGNSLSWIHYTHLEKWYGKLGYRTVLRWNGKGFLD